MSTKPITSKSILGVKVHDLSRSETMEYLRNYLQSSKKEPLHVVTAYSEFFVIAQKDKEFSKVLNEAELVLPDGVGPLAAMSYSEVIKRRESFLTKFLTGLQVGSWVVQGKVGETVTGVWLFQQLVAKAAENNWKVFLLGGFDGVAEKLTIKLKNQYPKLKVEFDPGLVGSDLDQLQSEAIIKRIADYEPDVLFVAYGPVKQEKWIAQHKKELKARILVGVGGTFDELTGKIKPPAPIFAKLGLKWLGRLIIQPQRLPRILNAFPVFPLLVFSRSLKK